ITFVSYQTSSFFNDNNGLVRDLLLGGDVTESAIYSLAVSFIILFFGFLFGFSIAHQAINKEVELKTIRLIVSKRSMRDIMVGKLIGNYLLDRKSTRLNSSHVSISYAVFCLKKKMSAMMLYDLLISLTYIKN